MEVAYFPYQLSYRYTTGTQNGALLRFTFEEDLLGYADCHPREEFGDAPLTDQLSLLQKGVRTLLTRKSWDFAKQDALARQQNRSLFAGKNIPSSHLFIPNHQLLKDSLFQQWVKEGITHIKIKGMPSKPHFDLAKKWGIQFRLDFNNRLFPEQFRRFLDEVDLTCIDFIEDPFPFDLDAWALFQKEYPISLACDHCPEKALHYPEAARVLVIKPVKQRVSHFAVSDLQQKLVVTSYIDHPVGQMFAAYEAAEHAEQVYGCGILSHYAYKDDPFVELLKHQGPNIQVPQGTGIGFDTLLEKLAWQEL